LRDADGHERTPAATPPTRPARAPEPRPGPPRYERLDGPGVEIVLTDLDADVWTFAGEPDLIILSARTFPAAVTLTDRLNREDRPITVPVGQVVNIAAPRSRVRGRNLVAGSVALLSVTGCWNARAEAGHD
jgi:hypothetical protein